MGWQPFRSTDKDVCLLYVISEIQTTQGSLSSPFSSLSLPFFFLLFPTFLFKKALTLGVTQAGLGWNYIVQASFKFRSPASAFPLQACTTTASSITFLVEEICSNWSFTVELLAQSDPLLYSWEFLPSLYIVFIYVFISIYYLLTTTLSPFVSETWIPISGTLASYRTEHL